MVLCLFFSFCSLADDRDRALHSIQRAVLAYPEVKTLRRNAEKKLFEYLPIDKQTFGVVGGLAVSASQGHVDTKVIKNMNFKAVGANVRPDIRYDFRNNQTEGVINLNWSF